MKRFAILFAGALLVASSTGCTFHSAARDFNGLAAHDGRPVNFTSTSKVGLRLLVLIPFLGNMDIDGLVELLQRLRDGDIERVAVDTSQPSAFARSILHAMPYAFLDDAPLEERRTQAVSQRHVLDQATADEVGTNPRLQPVEEFRVHDGAILDDFSHAGAEFTRRQGIQGLRVNQHHAGLVESTQQVLAPAVIYPGLATHRAVHLRQQGGWHLEKPHSAHVGSGSKAADITDHATPQSDQVAVAPGLHTHQPVDNAGPGGHRLVRFAIGYDVGGAIPFPQRCKQSIQVQGRYYFIADNQGFAGAQYLPRFCLVQQPGTDVYRVAALPQINPEGE